MKTLELKGLPSFYATQAFHKLMIGLKMLPEYLGETYEVFFQRLDQLSEADQEGMIRQAALFVKLEPDEQFDLMQFCADANGIPYCAQNTRGLTPQEIHEIIVSVSMEIMRSHKVRLISESEKKN